MGTFVLLLLLAAFGGLCWRLWHSRYRRAALRGLAAGVALTLGMPFVYGLLFGVNLWHASARPGLEGGLSAALLYGLLLMPFGLPLGLLAGVAWQWVRQRRPGASTLPTTPTSTTTSTTESAQP
ncbi:hypothetical protein QRD43_06575 [Pelomonas sp. APW6]|uniref:Uncharacterized protein n=1 Tax=Roseateles subflavus TaxID=3053353 RepID=A0ABT7LGL8_9BURK|nr:hypothetical protein [Pelomonas sp. APW6]MDL5031569.1 hypothetical protein [Pelomonas sp. APW6]